MEGALLGICNPLLDISAEVPAEILAKYELKPNNAILAEPKHLPLYSELVEKHKVDYIAGGAGQNTIRAAQWMMQTPGVSVYLGCVGNDKNAEILAQEAKRDGVTTHYMVDSEQATGTCAVCITQKERSLIANLAAANCYKKSHFDSEPIQALVQKAKFFYVTGFFITVSFDTIVAIGEHAVANNKTFLANISAPFLVDFFWDQLQKVISFADYFFGNESEYAALAKKLNLPSDDLKAVAKAVAELPKENKNRKRTVVITQGSHQTIVCHEGEVHEFPTPKIPQEELVDTNGAGDSFVGGFLSALIFGKSIKQCVDAGHYCAGVTIRTSGTSFTGKKPTLTH